MAHRKNWKWLSLAETSVDLKEIMKIRAFTSLDPLEFWVSLTYFVRPLLTLLNRLAKIS